MTKCSLGICVYNEEKNIAKLLECIFTQKLKTVLIDEIIIISSGSIDKTNKIIEYYAKKNKIIKIFFQSKREGKALAVNLFIKKARNNILVLLGGDILLTENAIENLVKELNAPNVGMTGSHPVPVNDINNGLGGFAANLLWELHHRICLKKPKMGEMIAFRKIFEKIPIISSVDEANIEPLIRGQGYLVKYVPEAIVYNKAPLTIKEFIRQRRRIYSGHLAVKFEQSYEVSTLGIFTILTVLFAFLKDNPKPKFVIFTPLVIILEGYSRFLGWWDYKISNKKHTIWETVNTTKDP